MMKRGIVVDLSVALGMSWKRNLYLWSSRISIAIWMTARMPFHANRQLHIKLFSAYLPLILLTLNSSYRSRSISRILLLVRYVLFTIPSGLSQDWSLKSLSWKCKSGNKRSSSLSNRLSYSRCPYSWSVLCKIRGGKSEESWLKRRKWLGWRRVERWRLGLFIGSTGSWKL